MISPKSELPSTGEQPSTVVGSISQLERHCCPGASKPVPRGYSTLTTHYQANISRLGRRHSATHPLDDRLHSRRRRSNVLRRLLLRCHECIVNNISEEYCPPMLLPIPSDYADTLERISKMAIKGVLPLPLKMILNTYYPLPSQPQPPRPLPQCDAPPRRLSIQSTPQQQCSATRMVTAEKTTVERSAEKKCIEESTEGKMEPELGELESSSSAGTDLKHPESSVSRTGRWNQPPSTAVRESTGVVDERTSVDGGSFHVPVRETLLSGCFKNSRRRARKLDLYRFAL